MNKETQNFLNVLLLINDTAAKALRKLFKDLWLAVQKCEWKNTADDGKDLIRGIGQDIYRNEFDKQKENLKSGDIHRWDLLLLVKIIRKLLKQLQKSGDPSICGINDNDLISLRDIRNEMAHPGSFQLTDEKFESKHNEISRVLKMLGVSDQELKNASVIFEADPALANETVPVNAKNTEEALKLKEKGNNLLKNGDIKGAIAMYSEAIFLSNVPMKDQAVLHTNRSKAHLDMNMIEQAIEDANEAVSIYPRWWKGYCRLAMAHEAAGDFQNAIKFYNIALALDPTAVDVEEKISNCQFKQALKKIEPKYLFRSVAECVETHLKETEPGDSKNKMTEAKIQEAKDKLKSEDSYLGFIIKGHLCRAMGKFKEAGELFQKAAKMQDNLNAEALYNLAMLMIDGKLENSKFSEAIRFLKTAAEQNSKRNAAGVSESEFILGLYNQESTKNYSEAVFWYRKSSSNKNGLAANNLAILFDEGVGVLRNPDFAADNWEIAAHSKQKVVSAMESLSKHFLEKSDFDRSMQWFTDAVENGSVLLSKKKTAYQKDIELLKNLSMNWSRMPRSSELAQVLKIRIDAKIKEMLEVHFEFRPEDKITPFNNRGVSIPQLNTLITKFSLKDDETIRKLKTAASCGNETSKILLETVQHYSKAVEILSNESSDEVSVDKAIHEMACAIRLEQHFINIPIDFSYKLWGTLKSRILIDDSVKTELDKDCRVCYCYLSGSIDKGNFNRVISFAEESLKKYPEEPTFYFYIGSMYGFKQEYAKGVKETNKALEIHPENQFLLYNKAALGMQCGVVSNENCIKDYLKFLKHTPIGSRNIPEAYYTISLLYATMYQKSGSRNGELYKNMIKYWESGKESEKSLAPCYLPYENNFKSQAHETVQVLDFGRKFSLGRS